MHHARPSPSAPIPNRLGDEQSGGSTFGTLDVQSLFSQVSSALLGALACLRESQQVLARATKQSFQHTNAKLNEISSTTHSAATQIMDGLDRALVLVDGIEEGASSTATGLLRDELFGVMNLLQFQDITSQQMQYVSSVLGQTETQLAEFVRLLDPDRLGVGPAATAETTSRPRTFDPVATVQRTEQRQALVDSLLPSASAR